MDTSILVAAVRSSAGASNLLLRAALEGKFVLLASMPLVLEYEAVLTRAEHLEESGLTPKQMEALLNSLVQVSVPVHIAFYWRPMLKDPDDDMVLETFVNGRADALVTFNQRDFKEVAKRFGGEVILPKQAWEKVRKL